MRSLILMLALVSWVAAAVQAPSGAPRTTTADDFFRHPQKSKKYNELWSYQFVFDNGTKAFVNYSWLFLPQQGNKVGCDLSFWNLKGKNYSVGRQYPTERYSEDKSRKRISIKEEYLMENLPGKGHRVLFTADKNGLFFLDLTFTEADPGMVAGNGIFDVNGNKHGLYLHIPWGRVKGRIGYGKDTIEVQGYGFMDQSWQTDQATQLAARSVLFSSPTSKHYYAGQIGMTGSGEPFGYAVYSKDGNTQLAMPKATQDKGAPYKAKDNFPSLLTIQWQDPSVPDLQFDTSKRQQKFSMLSNFDGWFEKKAVKFMMDGELFFLRGRSSTTQGNQLDWSITGF